MDAAVFHWLKERTITTLVQVTSENSRLWFFKRKVITPDDSRYFIDAAVFHWLKEGKRNLRFR